MNSWDEKFKNQQYVYGTEANAFVQEHMDIFSDCQTIACYAEGEGRNAVFLAQQGKDVTAYDYAQEGLRKTAELAKKQQVDVKLQHADLIEDTLLAKHYDGAVMIFGHFAKEHQYQVLDKIIGSLKKDGIFLLEVYSEEQLNYKTGGPPNIDFLYNAKQLKTWAEQWEIVHYFEGETERFEGTGHTGRCHVIQIIIKKK